MQYKLVYNNVSWCSLLYIWDALLTKLFIWKVSVLCISHPTLAECPFPGHTDGSQEVTDHTHERHLLIGHIFVVPHLHSGGLS